MFRYMKYGPYICIGVVLSILFILWAFWGGKNYEFVGLAPLSPETCGSYTGSFYNWGNITPATGYDPIEGHNCVPPDTACSQENIDISTQSSQHQIVVDNTPSLPSQFSLSNITNSSRKNFTDPTHTSNISELNSFNDTSSLQSEIPSDFLPPEDPICVQETSEQQVPLILDYNPRARNSKQNRGNSSQLVNNESKNGPILLPQPRNPSTIRPQQRGRFISRGERMCCQTMERIYGVPFTSTWPNWLRNPETDETLELDCYNDDLKIAVEYNGEQHYKWPNFTNQTYQQFINQVRRDTLKLDLCDKNGVYLIVVPYNVPYENIPSYIMSHLPETIQKRLQEENTLSSLNL